MYAPQWHPILNITFDYKLLSSKCKNEQRVITQQEGHDGPGVAHLSLLTKHNQFPTSCEIYVLPNNKILNSSV